MRRCVTIGANPSWCVLRFLQQQLSPPVSPDSWHLPYRWQVGIWRDVGGVWPLKNPVGVGLVFSLPLVRNTGQQGRKYRQCRRPALKYFSS